MLDAIMEDLVSIISSQDEHSDAGIRARHALEAHMDVERCEAVLSALRQAIERYTLDYKDAREDRNKHLNAARLAMPKEDHDG